MARVTSDLLGVVASFGHPDSQKIVASIQAPADGLDCLLIEATIDDTAGEMAYGTGIASQVVEMVVYVAGYRVSSHSLLAVSVSRSAEEMLQRWSFTVELPDSGGIFSVNPIYSRAPSTRLGSINIYGFYQTSTGAHWVNLIYDGIADTEDRTWGDDGLKATFTGVDRAGRFDGETFNLVLTPGHGIARARVAEMIANSVGIRNVSFEDDGAIMMKEVQAADAQALPLIQELADVENRKIMMDRNGELVWVKMGDPGGSYTSTFDTRHVLMGSVSVSQPGDVITEVSASGDEQVPTACGDVSTQSTNSTFSLEFPITMSYLQNTGGTFTAVSSPGTPSQPILTRYEVRDRIERCGVITYERTKVFEYFNPQSVRYIWNNSTYEWETLGGVYVSNAVIDAEPAYEYDTEKFIVVSDDEVWHYWNTAEHNGMGTVVQHPSIVSGPSLPGNFYYPINTDPSASMPGSDWDGVKLGTFRRSKRYFSPRQFVKERDRSGPPPFQTWDEVTPADNLMVLGSGEAIDGFSETLRIVSEEETFNEVDAKGYKLGSTTHRFGWTKGEGTIYLFGDNTTSDDQSEIYRYIGSVYETIAPTGESSHDRTVNTTGKDGSSTGSTVETGNAGYAPAAERIPDSGPSEPVDGILSQGEIDASYQRSHRVESNSMEAVVLDESLEDNHPRRVMKFQAPYAENLAELEAMAWAILDAAAAAKVSFTLAGANFYVEPGQAVRLNLSPLGISHTVRVVSVSWDFSGGAITTSVRGEIYAR